MTVLAEYYALFEKIYFKPIQWSRITAWMNRFDNDSIELFWANRNYIQCLKVESKVTWKMNDFHNSSVEVHCINPTCTPELDTITEHGIELRHHWVILHSNISHHYKIEMQISMTVEHHIRKEHLQLLFYSNIRCFCKPKCRIGQ